MSRSYNTLKTSDVTNTALGLKCSSSYTIEQLPNSGVEVYIGTNGELAKDGTYGPGFLNYRSIRSLYYMDYISGSVSASAFEYYPQSTAASGTFDNDYRYLPTGSSDQIIVYSIPRDLFGEKIARRTFKMQSNDNGTHYTVVDDGNGNLIDLVNGNAHVGNIIYAQGMVIVTNPSYLTSFVPSTNTVFSLRLVMNAFEYIDTYNVQAISPFISTIISDSIYGFSGPYPDHTGITNSGFPYFGPYLINGQIFSTFRKGLSTNAQGCMISMSDSSGNTYQSYRNTILGGAWVPNQPPPYNYTWGSNTSVPSEIGALCIPSQNYLTGSDTYLDIYKRGSNWATGDIRIVDSTGLIDIFNVSGPAAVSLNAHTVFSSSYNSNAPYTIQGGPYSMIETGATMSFSVMDLSHSFAETHFIPSGSSITALHPMNSLGWGTLTDLPSYISIRINKLDRTVPSTAYLLTFSFASYVDVALPVSGPHIRCTSINGAGAPILDPTKELICDVDTTLPYVGPYSSPYCNSTVYVTGVKELEITFLRNYIDKSFKYTSSGGTIYYGVFMPGNIYL